MLDEEQDAEERVDVLEDVLEKADEPVMPAPTFPTFHHTPTLPHQLPGNGFESGRDSRAR
ncbi:hypothetical protein [Actinoplanes couchii]|uniref:Uncharacterized protein n=1 Tax=Actinoplanes couchii TaxID=403638 RepID=A0ABQ3XBD8_9ACTN|nr:hypothetical protein [Actinoplanes couchii]MDR6323311.1 hypothetical protein [Actinoplanes couchii]GID55824.1 hypothetical protein Aco03nite_042280 [Actinoplanes couchii]